MVFHYSNFIWETNAWWLRRIRPLWLPTFLFGVAFASYRYVFFGKIQAFWLKFHGEEELQKRALENKRDWGYGSYYKPTLERSRKKMIMEAQGENYRHAETWPEMYMHDNRSLEEIMEAEDNWE